MDWVILRLWQARRTDEGNVRSQFVWGHRLPIWVRASRDAADMGASCTADGWCRLGACSRSLQWDVEDLMVRQAVVLPMSLFGAPIRR